MKVEIRECRLEDHRRLADLAGQLGYPCLHAEALERMRACIVSPTRGILVA